MTRIIPIAIGLLLLACGSATSSETEVNAMERSPGQSNFNTNCSLCHGRDGKLGLNGAKDLTASALSKDEMKAIIRSGKGAMMPYKDVLTPKEIDAVVEHIRTLGKGK